MSEYDTAEIFVNGAETKFNVPGNTGVGTFRDQNGRILEQRLEHGGNEPRELGYTHHEQLLAGNKQGGGGGAGDGYASIEELLADSGNEEADIEELLADSGEE